MDELKPHNSLFFNNKNIIISYELFGNNNSKNKILFIMGFMSESRSYAHQIAYFKKLDNYQFCILDNRGIGKSSAPWGIYTTSIMANDCLKLMNHLGWERAHIVGTSMGGMIAQELAIESPLKVQSLTLLVTHAGGLLALPTFNGVWLLLKVMFIDKDIDERLKSALKLMYSKQSLNYPEKYKYLYDYHAARLANLAKRRISGIIGQHLAVTSHHVSFENLYNLRNYPFKTLIIGVKEDNLVHPIHSHILHEAIGGNLKIVESGHSVICEVHEDVNDMLLEHLENSNYIIKNEPLQRIEKFGCDHRGTCFFHNMKSIVSCYSFIWLIEYLIKSNNGLSIFITSLIALLSSGHCIRNYLYFLLKIKYFHGFLHLPLPSFLIFIYVLIYLYSKLN